MNDNLRYPDHPGHRGVETSVAAAVVTNITAGGLRRRVQQAIIEAGSHGLTTDEATEVLGMPRYSVQPRTTELKHRGLIRDSGRRRPNASGCRAIVWIAVEGEGRHGTV